MKASKSKLRLPLVLVWLALSAGALVYLTLPSTAPLLFNRFMAGKGWTTQGCDLSYDTPYFLRGSGCTITVPLEKDPVIFAVRDFGIDIAGESLTVRSGTVSFGEYSAEIAGILRRLPAGRFELDANLTNPRAAPPLTIESGRFALRGEFSETSSLVLTIREASGRYNDLTFEKLSTVLSFGGFPDWKTDSAKTHIVRVDAGIPLEDIGFRVALNKGKSGTSNIKVSDFTARALGGNIGVDSFSIVNKKRSSFVLKIVDADLTQLLAYLGESVQGSGRVSGELPIEFSDGLPTIGLGKLQSSDGGTLRYVAGEESSLRTSENPNLQLAVKALEDFTYESLAADVSYDKDGNLKAAVSLTGRNSALTERPIRFNINVEENIPLLLRSIRLATQAGKEVWQPDQPKSGE